MGRIRTVKPELLRHEKLQELEQKHAEARPMLVFIGLFTQCDRMGRFEWKPRHLKLDILPFVDFKMENTLDLLERSGFIKRYVVEGKTYGHIPTWSLHQRITGQEATAPPRYPEPPAGGNTEEIPSDSIGNNTHREEEAPKSRERGRKPKGKTPQELAADLKLEPELEAWFEACWFDVYPQQVVQEGVLVTVNRGRPALARERFERCCKKWKPVAIWLALRGYLKKDPQVKKGYIQEFSTFLGPEKPIATSKRTLESYLESVFPFLEAHPSIDALTAPPESDEAFRALVKQDEVAHV